MGWSDKGMTAGSFRRSLSSRGCKGPPIIWDGGGSETMIMGGERVNKTSGSRERNVSDIVYFTK